MKKEPVYASLNHTPGPVVRWKGFDADNYVIVECTGQRASLRTAAPELLAALLEIEAQLSAHPEADRGNSKVHFAMHKARAAIARARDEK